jgi:hypothetical protein
VDVVARHPEQVAAVVPATAAAAAAAALCFHGGVAAKSRHILQPRCVKLRLNRHSLLHLLVLHVDSMLLLLLAVILALNVALLVTIPTRLLLQHEHAWLRLPLSSLAIQHMRSLLCLLLLQMIRVLLDWQLAIVELLLVLVLVFLCILYGYTCPLLVTRRWQLLQLPRWQVPCHGVLAAQNLACIRSEQWKNIIF